MSKHNNLNNTKLVKALDTLRHFRCSSLNDLRLPGIDSNLLEKLEFFTESDNHWTHQEVGSYYAARYGAYLFAFTPTSVMNNPYRNRNTYSMLEIHLVLENEYPELVYKPELFKRTAWRLEGLWVSELIELSDRIIAAAVQVRSYEKEQAKSLRAAGKDFKRRESEYKKNKEDRLSLKLQNLRDNEKTQ